MFFGAGFGGGGGGGMGFGAGLFGRTHPFESLAEKIRKNKELQSGETSKPVSKQPMVDAPVPMAPVPEIAVREDKQRKLMDAILQRDAARADAGLPEKPAQITQPVPEPTAPAAEPTQPLKSMPAVKQTLDAKKKKQMLSVMGPRMLSKMG